MPLYDFVCQNCGKTTEVLIRHEGQKPKCPCGSDNLKKTLSAFAVNSHGRAASSSSADGSCPLGQSSCASGMCGL